MDFPSPLLRTTALLGLCAIAAAAGPGLTGLSTGVAVAGGGPMTLTAYGSGFVEGSVVRWNSTALATSFTSSSLLAATIPAALLANPVTVVVSVQNPDGSVSAGMTFTVALPFSIQFLSPPAATAGGPDFSFYVNGTGFVTGSVVQWNGTPMPTTYATENILTAVASAKLLTAPGTASIRVVNPGGATTNTATMTITASPRIFGLSPAPPTAGGPGFTLTVDGAGFSAQSTVLWNGGALATTFVNGSTLTAAVPASLIAAPGTATVLVSATDGTRSLGVAYSITAPAAAGPAIQQTSSATLMAGSPATIQILGTGFVPGCTALWNTTTLPLTIGSATQASVSVPGNLLVAGMASLFVVSPSGAKSAPVYLNVAPAPLIVPPPVLTGWNAADLIAGDLTLALVLNGSGFQAGATVRWNGTTIQPYDVNATRIQAVVAASLMAAPGTVTVAVVNPDGVVSNALSAAIAPLGITSLSPASATTGSPGFDLTVGGAFRAGAVVDWSGYPLPTVFLDRGHLRATVVADLLRYAGTARITAHSPAGSDTPAISFPVTGPSPALLSTVDPASVVAGSAAISVTVGGSGFDPAAVVLWNGSALPTTFVTSGRLLAAVSDTLLATPGLNRIEVQNPGAALSNASTLTVLAPDARITSLSPATVSAGSGAVTLAVNGSGFRPDSYVEWGIRTLETTYVGPTLLRAVIPASLTATPTAGAIRVVNSNGNQSPAQVFAVLPIPGAPYVPGSGVVNAATGFAPSAAGSLISIFGANLADGEGAADGLPLPTTIHGTTVRIGGRPVPLLFVSPTQINAQVPFETATGIATLEVETNGVRVSALFDVLPTAPGVFGDAKQHAVAVHQKDWSLNSAANPAVPGDWVVLYVTGQGALDHPVATGDAAPSDPLARPLAETLVDIGGSPAEVGFAGMAPGLVGVMQVNVRIPDTPSGERWVYLRIGGQSAPLAFVSIGN
jgi:uncharacterized protein (TIGR03437 family)